MVEITIQLTEKSNGIIDIRGRGSIIAPFTAYEQRIGKKLIPLLTEILTKIESEFPHTGFNASKFDSLKLNLQRRTDGPR